jgi:hypothetical protein
MLPGNTWSLAKVMALYSCLGYNKRGHDVAIETDLPAQHTRLTTNQSQLPVRILMIPEGCLVLESSRREHSVPEAIPEYTIAIISPCRIYHNLARCCRRLEMP